MAWERYKQAGPSKSPAVSGNSRACFQYDVFLSFRGEDTRHSFAGLLHDMLYLQGVRSFFDEQDLDKGKRIEVIFEAISRSKIFVPIFSERYAESKWCLREVAKMVEYCPQDGKERVIIPVFVGVQPRDVKHQTGPFEAAFQKHLMDKSEEVEGWKKALEHVGGISGFHLMNGDQRALMNMITAEIQKVLSFKKLLHEKEYLVGLELRIGKMMRRLNFEAKDVRIIAIHGIGGLGKTTLAGAIYNRSHRFFESCSFIENVREASKLPKGLIQLQQQLIKDLSKGKRGKEINNPNEGTQMIIDMVGIKSVLLVLDDVDDRNVLEAFAGNRSWFCPGSRIIITTRQEEILEFAELRDVDVYKLEELDEDESLQLFSYHAFRGDEAGQRKYLSLSKEIVSIGSGLPLVIETFGSLFKTAKSLEEWKELLEDLRVHQHGKVHEKLRICYDSLNECEKLIFLDIACFLVGKNADDAIYMWEAHRNLSPHAAVRSLENRSLVKINRGKFEMHDQIRNMGRKIVLTEHLTVPVKRSRLWREEDVVEAANSNTSEGNKIQGILFKLREQSKIKLSTQAFEPISELRMLFIDTAIFDDCDFRHFPASLKWLEWKECPLEALPLESKFKSLAVLNLSRSFIRQLWTETTTGSCAKELFEGLRVLDLSYCDCLNTTPNFAMAPNLKKLILDECSNLKEVDESIGSLRKLVFLSMRECVSLEALPNEIYQLNSLVVFNLEGCRKLVAFPQFPKASAADLVALGNPSPTLFPTSISSMVNNQPTYGELTNFTGGLCNLEALILRNCESLQILPNLDKFHSLRNLHIDGCQGLNNIRKYLFEDAFREWDEVSISGSRTMSLEQEFSFVLPVGCIMDPLLLQQFRCYGYGDPCENGTMKLRVQHKDIRSGQVALETIHEALCDASFSNDSVMDDCYTISFGRNDVINEAPRGESIIMKITTADNSKLTKVDVRLQRRNNFSGDDMKKPYISMSIRRAYMSLTGTSSPTKFELEFSMFFNHFEEDGPEVIKYSTSLDSRITHMMWKLDHVQYSEQLLLFGWTIEELIILTLIFSDSKVSWYERRHGTALPGQVTDNKVSRMVVIPVKTISFSKCIIIMPNLFFCSFFDKMTVLDLSFCKFIVKTPDFSRTLHLERLILDHCECLAEIGESIGKLKNLILLSIVGSTVLHVLPCAILQLNSLRILNLEGCSQIKSLPEASTVDVSMEMLQDLILDHCSSLTRLPDYVGRLSLHRLSLKGCRSLTRLPRFTGSLMVLEELNVAECKKLVKISGLQNLSSLKILHMNGCYSLDRTLIYRQLKEATFHDLEAFSISIVDWNDISPSDLLTESRNVMDTSYFNLLHAHMCRSISFPFPRRRHSGMEPLYVEKIGVAIWGTSTEGEATSIEIKNAENNVLSFVDVLHLEPDAGARVHTTFRTSFRPEVPDVDPNIDALRGESDAEMDSDVADDRITEKQEYGCSQLSGESDAHRDPDGDDFRGTEEESVANTDSDAHDLNPEDDDGSPLVAEEPDADTYYSAEESEGAARDDRGTVCYSYIAKYLARFKKYVARSRKYGTEEEEGAGPNDRAPVCHSCMAKYIARFRKYVARFGKHRGIVGAAPYHRYPRDNLEMPGVGEECLFIIQRVSSQAVPLPYGMLPQSSRDPNIRSPASSSYIARFRKDDMINMRLGVEALSADDASRVGTLRISSTHTTFWMERGDIWFRRSLGASTTVG